MQCLQSFCGFIDVLFNGLYICLLISVCVTDFMSSLCKVHGKQQIIKKKIGVSKQHC
jgi:hypothetical protein